MGDYRVWIFLKIIRSEPVIFFVGEFFKKMPGPAGITSILFYFVSLKVL